MHLLFDNACGIALFKTRSKHMSPDIKPEFEDYLTITQYVNLESFYRFKDTDEALEYTMKLMNNELPDVLKNFLEINCVKRVITDINFNQFDGNKNKGGLKVGDGTAVDGSFIGDLKTFSDLNLMRGIRMNQTKLLKIDPQTIAQSALALSHAISRRKIESDINKSDLNVIIGIELIEQLNKELNTYLMRIREIYGWYCPEVEAVFKGLDYVKFVHVFGKFKVMGEEEIESKVGVLIGQIDRLFLSGEEIVINSVDKTYFKGDADILDDHFWREEVLEAKGHLKANDWIKPVLKEKIMIFAKTSIGSELSEIDWQNLKR
ncbi:putative nucleolar protein 5-2, partial [Dictyocoela roeselum]